MDLIPYPSDEKLREGVQKRKVRGTHIVKDFHSECDELLSFPDEYLKARGWSVDAIIDGTSYPKFKKNKLPLAIFQSCLVWGMLEDLTKEKIGFGELTVLEDDGEVYFRTTNLPMILEKWFSKLSSVSREEVEKGYKHAKDVILAARLMFGMISQDTEGGDAGPHMYYHYLAVIGEAVVNELHSIAISASLEPVEGGRWDWSAVNYTMLEDLGWCEYAANLLTSTFSSPDSLAEYASRFSPDYGFVKVLQHSECRMLECLRMNLTGQTSCIKHWGDCAGCEYKKPLAEDIYNAIKQKVYPLIEIAENGDLSVIPYDEKMPYVAFSHVWAEGLGTYTELGLPICQILRIRRTLMACGTPARFWMDGLCIPTEPTVRKLAILRMRDIYKRATAVVVFDGCMGKVSVNAPTEEILLAMNCSSWVQRLWTLQEAMLASSIYFVALDGFFTGQLLESRIKATAHKDILARELFNPIKAFITQNPYSNIKEMKFWSLPTVLQWRSTNKPSDEILALGGLLDLDLAEYLNLDREHRMIKFLQEPAHVVLSEIIFNRPVSWMHIPGFRWAPLSFMGLHEVHHFPDSFPARVTSKGLESTYRALMIAREIDMTESPMYNLMVDGIVFEVLKSQAFVSKAFKVDIVNRREHDIVLLPGKDLKDTQSFLGVLAKIDPNWKQETDGDRIPVRFCILAQIRILSEWDKTVSMWDAKLVQRDFLVM